MAKESNLRVRVLARALRELRERARLTQEQAGERLRFTNRKMSRIETGQLPSFHELQAMLDVYGLVSTDWPPYVAMWERAKEKGWWHTYGEADRGYVRLEYEANVVREFQMGFIPGLLQTEEYARATCAAGDLSHDATERVVEVRRRRQQRLTAEDPLTVHAIIDQSVLAQQLPGIRDQLAHMVILSELENVTIQVLPQNGLHVGLFGSFIILQFPGPNGSDIAHVEHVAGSVQIEREEEVRRCRLAFDDLASRALSHGESVALIDRMVR